MKPKLDRRPVAAKATQDVFIKWGEQGHSLINELAAMALPAGLQGFYKQYLDVIVKHAMDADHEKKQRPSERPHHYINIDLYGPPPFSALPEDYAQAVAKFGKATITGRGDVPWHIETTWNELVKAFQAKSLQLILKHSAWLGHYVGDVHVPLHITANYDGQLTGQPGLHEYFETTMLKNYVSPQDIAPGQGKPLTEPVHKAAFKWVRESYSYVQALLNADAANGGKAKKRNLAGFAKTAKPIAAERLSKACNRTASLWYTAWLQADKPDVTAFELSVEKKKVVA